jgi:hypothetical protein
MSGLKEIYLLAAKDNLYLDPLKKLLFAAQNIFSTILELAPLHA